MVKPREGYMEASEAWDKCLLRAPLRKKQISIVVGTKEASNGIFKPTESKHGSAEKEGLRKQD